jgi:predicted TIM-barrel fold metal-dependent hydrolase
MYTVVSKEGGNEHYARATVNQRYHRDPPVTLCDSHIHIVGDPVRHPQVPDRTYTAGPALVPDLERVAAPLGVTRFVVVQPSFYGTDNAVLLDALNTLDGRGRGVAVLDPASIKPHELNTLAASGVRGLRINLYSTLSGIQSGAGSRRFADMAAVAATQNWHVEVIAPIAMLADMAPMLAQAPVSVVIDHYGLHQGTTPDSASGDALLGLLRQPHVWMKLSAPYRISADPLAVRPDSAWLAAILDACSDRCVWGSDWPHTPPHGLQTGHGVKLPYRALDYAAVLDGFRSSLPPGALVDAILCHNPARLYGFN